jgi:hypothetical protein
MASFQPIEIPARLTKADVVRIRPLKGKANADTFSIGEGIDWTSYGPGKLAFDTFAGRYDMATREWVGVLRFLLPPAGTSHFQLAPFDVLSELLSADTRAESEDDDGI